MKHLFLYASVFFLSVTAANATLINDEKSALSEQESKETKQAKLVSPAEPISPAQAASEALIDDLTERLYLDRKKRWEKDGLAN